MLSDILPANSSKFEKALTNSCAHNADLETSIDSLSRLKFIDRPADFLPFLIDEYGLNILKPYIKNLYDLIDEGLYWQKKRGSIDAVMIGLNWLGFKAIYSPEPSFRNWWNAYSLIFNTLPDDKDLTNIENIARLSESLRSDFRRGIYNYDVPAIEADESRLDGAILDSYSGVAINKTVWSFGRQHESDHTLTKSEGKALGNWLPKDKSSLKWVDAQYLWSTINAPWADYNTTIRQQIMTQWFNDKTVYMCFRQGDAIIGYRLCRVCCACSSRSDGAYKIRSQRLEPSNKSTVVYIEALTDFDNVQEALEADSISLIFFAQNIPQTPIGQQWLDTYALKSGIEIAVSPLSLNLRRTVREQIKFTLKV